MVSDVKQISVFALHPHRRKPDGGAVTPQLAVRAGKSEHNFRPCGQPQQGGLEILPGLLWRMFDCRQQSKV